MNTRYLLRFEAYNPPVIWIVMPGSYDEDLTFNSYSTLGETQIAALENLATIPNAKIRYLHPSRASTSPDPKPHEEIEAPPGKLYTGMDVMNDYISFSNLPINSTIYSE